MLTSSFTSMILNFLKEYFAKWAIDQFCPQWPGTKQGQACIKMGQERQNRDSRDKTGTSRYTTGRAMHKAGRTKVCDKPSLSLFCPCMVCPSFVPADLALLICLFLSLFYHCSVFAGFVLVLILLVLPFFVLDLSFFPFLFVLEIKKKIIFV